MAGNDLVYLLRGGAMKIGVAIPYNDFYMGAILLFLGVANCD